ncbi:related to TIF2 - translation initiation factor eIF4A [Melanopsichium pennsylvanicum]|uniref:RNA helicase n=2 Tax=Melanopsichium pennsylvanicum TaxID=63383 RepID=A0AAJ4XMB5_9BASI|nr:related to TIF2-translation initiation factor eIF4A [Melanopsichium pennsylvanicum 4]SNX83678.1 related to TIF2 - translation initiation factor eIF4A [Melanopsichium pennsylvanicum]
MSVSPFLPGNSIWSTNAPATQQGRTDQTGLGTSTGNHQNGLDAGNSLSASAGTEPSRIGAHPLPNKPAAPSRSNSAILNKSSGPTQDDAVRSMDSFMAAAFRPGVIGSARGGARGQKQADVSRSNSLAASINSYRSANSGSPLPASAQSFAQGSLNAQIGPVQSLQSPSLQDNGTISRNRSMNTSSETEFGTPRLFVDAQHIFDQDDRSATMMLSRSPSNSRRTGSGNNLGKPRPSSWMHPSSHDKQGDSLRSLNCDISGAAFPRPASSQGSHSHLLSGADADFNAISASKRSASVQFGHGSIDASHTLDTSEHTQAGLFGPGNIPTSPGIASGPLSRGGRPDHSAAAAAGRATPTLNVPSYINLSGGLLSPTAATIGSASASMAHSPVGSPLSGSGFNNPVQNRSVSAGHIFDEPAGPVDNLMNESPLIKDVLERLTRVEGGMKDFSRQISGISRNVSLLLERTKGLPPASLSSSGANASQNASVTNGANTADEVRALNAQVSALAQSVSHLMTLQGNGLGGPSAAGSAPSLNGLGLGPASGLLGTPQIGGSSGLDRAASPRVGVIPNGQFNVGPNGSFLPQNGLSPRPQGNGRGWMSQNSRGQEPRWNTPSQGGNARKDNVTGAGNSVTTGIPTTPSLDDNAGAVTGAQAGTGIIQHNAIVTKWEHLNLHTDLLRSILKYGLGPPNKIQQRALPFLLRGSDIIAQAPPTQERIASYVIPSLQLVMNVLKETGGPGQTASNRGPVALIVSTTVDQATQAQRMALGLGAPLGIRVHMLAASSIDVHHEAQSLVQSWPHIVVGTPQKMSELFTYMTNNASSIQAHGTGPGASAIKPSEVRLVVLDEVDQLIARNLADHISTMLRVLPLPSTPTGPSSSTRAAGGLSPGLPQGTNNAIFSPFDQRSEGVGTSAGTSNTIDRQVALFSNTVPQDVLNFAQSIHLRESVRVLVRRDGAGGGGSSLMQPPTGSASGMGGPNGPNSALQPTNTQRDMPQPTNALGAHPANSSVSVSKDPLMTALKGLRQYYLYIAVTSQHGGMGSSSPIPGLSHNPAGEMKLDLISDLLEDIDFGHTVIYCANVPTQEALIYKLSSKGIEALGLNREMNAYTRQQTIAKFRSPSSHFGTNAMISSATFAQPGGFVGVNAASSTRKALVVCDLAVNPKEVHQIALIVFYDMPRSVEDYKEKISCAAAGAMARPSVCVNVVTASGGPRGDVEMLRTLECHLGCKMAELPMDPKQILNF